MTIHTIQAIQQKQTILILLQNYRKTLCQLSKIVCVCCINPVFTVEAIDKKSFYHKRHKMSNFNSSQSSLSKTKFKFEPVTGSKQKHMAVPSIAGSALSLKYPLFQGLLLKVQLFKLLLCRICTCNYNYYLVLRFIGVFLENSVNCE